MRTLLLVLLLTTSIIADDTIWIDSGAMVEDSYLYRTLPGYGVGVRYFLRSSGSGNYRTVIQLDSVFADTLGSDKIITAAWLYLYNYDNFNSGGYDVHYVLKPIIEGISDGDLNADSGATWNDWDALDLEWGKAGCDSADDNGVRNSSDGTNADRKANTIGKFWNEQNGTDSLWDSVSLDTSVINSLYQNKYPIGLLIKHTADSTDSGVDSRWFSSEYETRPDRRPKWKFVTQDAAGVTPQVIIVD